MVFLDVEFSENEEQRGGQNGKRHFLFTLWLSQVQAGIFIPPGENANHQSRAASYVSV